MLQTVRSASGADRLHDAPDFDAIARATKRSTALDRSEPSTESACS